MASDTLTIIDNRTGKKYDIPIQNGAIKATDLFQIKVSEDDGLVSYDPGFMNTASCQSKITYIDGDKGILRYRGYPIEQIAEKSTYLETAYLILYGELPTPIQLAEWTGQHHYSFHHSRKYKETYRWLSSRCPSDGNFGQHGCSVIDFLSRRQENFRC